MYICSCHAVTDGQIKESVASGTSTFRELCQKLKCSTQCGICAHSAKEVFDQARLQQGHKPKRKKANAAQDNG